MKHLNSTLPEFDDVRKQSSPNSNYNLKVLLNLHSNLTAWKVFVFEVIPVCIFPHLDWITPNTGTFYAESNFIFSNCGATPFYWTSNNISSRFLKAIMIIRNYKIMIYKKYVHDKYICKGKLTASKLRLRLISPESSRKCRVIDVFANIAKLFLLLYNTSMLAPTFICSSLQLIKMRSFLYLVKLYFVSNSYILVSFTSLPDF